MGTPLTHGHTVNGQQTPTYISWQAMLSRVRYALRDRNNMWATKGVKVSPRWEQFENFLSDMGERPAGTTLDRFPNRDGDYEPGNCRWATPRQQARNTRKAKLTFETAFEVAVARLRGVPCPEIAARHGICESLPREIAKGRCWLDALWAAKIFLGLPLPCPWCGHDADAGRIGLTSRYGVDCTNGDCPVEAQATAGTMEEAIRLWNTRASAPHAAKVAA